MDTLRPLDYPLACPVAGMQSEISGSKNLKLLTRSAFLAEKIRNPAALSLRERCDKGALQIKRPYISNLGWVGFGVGFEKIYRAIWFNVNAIIAETKGLSRDFLIICFFS